MEDSLSQSTQNTQIKHAIIKSIKQIFPIEKDGKKLELVDIQIHDTLDDHDFPLQKKLKTERRSWQNPITASFAITDGKTGRVISKANNIKIGNIPKLTNRFTTIIDGNEYQTNSQIRRKSGIYSRIKKNGELESEFNLIKGRNFKMQLDPNSEQFNIIFENRKYRLWTLLNHLGVGDSEMVKKWGPELLEINKKGALNTEASELMSMYKVIFHKEPKDLTEAVKGLKDYFLDYTRVDEDTTKITLGKSFDKVDGNAMLAASHRLLKINRGEEKPDERDNLIYKNIFAVDDLLGAYFESQTPIIKKKLERTLGFKDQVREVISGATFTDPIKKFFTTGDMTSPPPQTNPVTILDEARKTTPMGTGGIGSTHAITGETRAVQPTHLGFLDPLSTPEGLKVGIKVGLASGTKKVGNNFVTPVRDLQNKEHWLNPTQFYNYKVGFPDQFTIKDDKLVALFPYASVMYKGVVTKVPKNEVDFYLKSPKAMFSLPQNLIPFLANTHAGRANMAFRMYTQALAIDQKETPLVQTFRNNNTTYEDLVGSYLNPKPKFSGTVHMVDNDYIHIKSKDGKQIDKIGLYNNFPLNQDGYLNSKVLVKPGDVVSPETTLTENNYSIGDTLSLGKNLTVGYMSYKGYTFEDGIVVTDEAAKKLSHTMLHKSTVQYSPKLSMFNKKKFIAWYPDEFTGENLSKLDDKGFIKIGETVHTGDTILAFLVEKEMDDTEQSLKKLHKITFSPYAKNITTWEYDDPGVITDIKDNGSTIDIYIKSVHPLKVGDKLSGRFGNKGIVTKIIPVDEAPHRMNGQALDIMLSPEGVPGRMNIGQILEVAASKIAEKTGKPYIVKNFGNPNEDMSAKILKDMQDLGLEPNETLIDGKTGRKIESPIFVGKQYILKLKHIVDKKEGVHNFGQYDINEQPAGKGTQHTGSMEIHAYLAHGSKCFIGSTLVETNKGPLPIYKIYESNEQLFAKCLENEKIVYKPIINKFKRKAHLDELINIKKGSFRITTTLGHEFYQPDLTKKEIGETNIAVVENKDNTSERQKQIIIGSFLGDGYISKYYNLKITHCEKQKNYLQYKLNLLNVNNIIGPFYNNGYSNSIEYSGSTPVSNYLRYIRTIGYPNNKKIINKEILDELNLEGLAIFYQDDGTFYSNDLKCVNTVRLSTYSFTKEENELLKNKIIDLTGCNFDVRLKDNKYWFLKCSRKNDLEKFFLAIAPFMCETMFYKIPEKYHILSKNSSSDEIKEYCPVGIKKYKYSFPPSKKDCTFKWVYNIEVADVHNYFLSTGYLVGNSNLYEMSNIKGRKNEEYWRDLQFGLTPGKPNRNFAFEKMMAYLKGAGINSEKNGNKIRIFPLLDSDVKSLSNGEIKDPGALLIGKNLMTRKNGLFDTEITGGIRGNNWSHINLATRIPNPTYADPIMKLLGLTEAKYKNIIAGKEELNKKTGVDAIVDSLKAIDVSKELKKYEAELKIAPPTNVNKLNTTVRYLETLKDLKYTPVEAYTISKIPVLPPVFRTVYPLPSGDLQVNDLNKHYRAVGLINMGLKDRIKEMGDKDKLEATAGLYDSVSALQGYTDPITYSDIKYKGYMKELSEIKTGLIQGLNWQKPQDMSARSTIVVEPDLGIDEIGMPKDLSYELMKPFIIRDMKQSGVTASNALDYYNKKNNIAENSLVNVMRSKSVLLNRAPSLHKHSVMSFKPILTDGQAIKINPLIVKGFNADFDGDTMSVMVPIGKEAEEEAKQMRPSMALFKHGDNALMPELSKDYIFGLYDLSLIKSKSGKTYSSINAAKESGIDWHTEFRLHGTPMTIGQYLINEPLPEALRDYTRTLDSRAAKKILETIGKDYKNRFPDVINAWKNLGAEAAYYAGHTISITDFAIDHSIRDNMLKTQVPKIERMGTDQEKIEAYLDLQRKSSEAQDKLLPKNNNLKQMMDSGSFNKIDQVNQTIVMPGVLTDYEGKSMAVPVLKSFGEGLTTTDYWNTLYNARKNSADTALGTQVTGAFNKSLTTITRRLLVTTSDCGTSEGIELGIDDKNIIDRFLLESVPGIGKRNDLVNGDMVNKLRTKNINKILVRSPLTCKAVEGVCQRCYGLMPDGQIAMIGTNVGILEGTALAEQAVQQGLRSKHGGSALARMSVGAIYNSFDRLQQLFEVPEKLSGKATLSTLDGTVRAITKNPIGGYDIKIDNQMFKVTPGLLPKVNVGDSVSKGDAISEGVFKPQELGALTNHLTAQKYIVGETAKMYDKFYTKGIETVIRGVSDNARITKAPDGCGFRRGDHTSISRLEYLNSQRKDQGLELIEFQPYFKSIETGNTNSDDWLTRATTNRIKDGLTVGAAKGLYTNLKGKDPIPALIGSENFGKNLNYEKGEFY